jgi:hypothetical protein
MDNFSWKTIDKQLKLIKYVQKKPHRFRCGFL